MITPAEFTVIVPGRLGIRLCRGHWHVTSVNEDGSEGDDIWTRFDPLKTRVDAVIAAEALAHDNEAAPPTLCRTPIETPSCDCADWAPGVRLLNAPIITAQARNPSLTASPDFQFIAWKFCPWCGKSLASFPSLEGTQAPAIELKPQTPTSGINAIIGKWPIKTSDADFVRLTEDSIPDPSGTTESEPK